MQSDRYADADREQVLWMRILGIPFLAASAFIAAALGGAGSWFMFGAIFCGPGLGVLALVYLALSSDNNRAGASDERPHHVVVVGGGFAGLQAVHGLRRAPVEVTLIDRRPLS
jgi:hypothetical protein